MKALLLSFFVVVLCYSLFLDEEQQAAPSDRTNKTTMQTEAYDYVQGHDTTAFYAITSLPWSWQLVESPSGHEKLQAETHSVSTCNFFCSATGRVEEGLWEGA